MKLSSDNKLEHVDAHWATNEYFPWTRSMVRGNYRMHSDCSVYKFDAETKTITRVNDAENFTGFVSNTGQNSLFCQYSPSESSDELPTFLRFDIKKAEAGQDAVTTVTVSSGTSLDAGERTAVVNDNELMFYEYPSGDFTEYYVNFDAGTTTEKLVKSITPIKMQTVDVEK
jgi:hypothetical protein